MMFDESEINGWAEVMKEYNEELYIPVLQQYGMTFFEGLMIYHTNRIYNVLDRIDTTLVDLLEKE